MKRFFAALGIAATMSQPALADMDGFTALKDKGETLTVGAVRRQIVHNNNLHETYNFQAGIVCHAYSISGISCLSKTQLSEEGQKYFDKLKAHFVPN